LIKTETKFPEELPRQELF